MSASDVVAQTSPQSFVIAVWQFLAALMVGARVHICADEEMRDPALLMQEISREGITVLRSCRRCCAKSSSGPQRGHLSCVKPTSLR